MPQVRIIQSVKDCDYVIEIKLGMCCLLDAPSLKGLDSLKTLLDTTMSYFPCRCDSVKVQVVGKCCEHECAKDSVIKALGVQQDIVDVVEVQP